MSTSTPAGQHSRRRTSPGRTIIGARLRPGTPHPAGDRTIGERDRQVHLVILPAPLDDPPRLHALCGQQINPADADLVHAATGMPCTACLARIPTLTPAWRGRRTGHGTA